MGAPKGAPICTPPKGCALMGWVPYPAHMGPRFAGPITALRALKKKKNTCGRVRAWAGARERESVRGGA